MPEKSATGEEAAAIAAAVARFEAELAAASSAAAPPPTYGAWQRAALLEGVSAKETPEEQGGARWQW